MIKKRKRDRFSTYDTYSCNLCVIDEHLYQDNQLITIFIMAGIFYSQYLTIIALIGIVSSFTIQTKQNEDVPGVVEELLNLLTVS